MHCPFLRDATVTFCRQAPFARALPLEVIDVASSRCNGPAHSACPYAPRETGGGDAGHCPAIEERQVRFCVAAAAPKPVPALTMLPSRCITDAHRHCALYLERVVGRSSGAAHGASRPAAEVDGIEVPLALAFTPGHLWVDRGDDGSCTVGVDSFLVRVIGAADRVTFVSTGPGVQPLAVLSVAGLDLPLACPSPLEHVVFNYALRVAPERLALDPYGSGWLFEGRWAAESGVGQTSPGGFIGGPAAVSWMRREVVRLSTLVHELVGERPVDDMRAAADGGTFAAGVARVLHREDAQQLLAGFFSVQRWIP